MPRIQRTSDVIEQHSERAVMFIFGAVALGAIATLLLVYRGDGNFVPIGVILALAAAGLLGYALYEIFGVRKVASYALDCPFCTERVEIADEPGDLDVACTACNRMIPLVAGQVVTVSQVRCGFCNGLNYYSEKTEVLLCEACNHEVPISRADGASPSKRIAKRYAVVSDDALYELVLTGGKESDELLGCLQQMLALNRKQVKEIFENTPVKLLQGITRMKADMLKAQIESHAGKAEARVLEDAGVG